MSIKLDLSADDGYEKYLIEREKKIISLLIDYDKDIDLIAEISLMRFLLTVERIEIMKIIKY